MQQTHTLIVGASFSGLASAAALQKMAIANTIIEKQSQVAAPWRNHYERLHLHTNKRVSNLPYKKFARNVPRYPSREQVVAYLESYRQEFNINPLFQTKATSIKRINDSWITETNNGSFQSNYVVVATGAFGKPKPVEFKGMETFGGSILHSAAYKTGKIFRGQKVLVVGFGNSACEIAIDLYEQGARTFMSVHSPVNVIPRDILGIPILEISQLMSKLPPRIADTINVPLLRLLVGDLGKLGLKKMSYGPFEQIQKTGNTPVLDIGTIKHIRQGHIQIFGGIDRIENRLVHFTDGKAEEFDTIVAAIGYYRDYTDIIDVDKTRFEDLRWPIQQQKYFGKDGLYFCGFYISPIGQIQQIGKDALKIAKDISRREKNKPV